jgi:hypothetical protein
MLPACRTTGSIYTIPYFDIDWRDVEVLWFNRNGSSAGSVLRVMRHHRALVAGGGRASSGHIHCA